jgi:hypothetical protein
MRPPLRGRVDGAPARAAAHCAGREPKAASSSDAATVHRTAALDLGPLRRGQPGIEPVLAFLLRCFSRSPHACRPPRFLALRSRCAGCPEGVSPRPDGPPRAGFLGTKNTSGYTDHDTTGMVKASIKCRGIPDAMEFRRRAGLRAAVPARETRPKASACIGGRGLGFRAFIGQEGGKLAVLLAALLVRPVEPSPQILKLFVELFPLPVVHGVEFGHAFEQLFKLALQTPVFKPQIGRFEIVQMVFFWTVRGRLGGEDSVQLGGVDGIGAVLVLRGGNHAAVDGFGNGGLGFSGRLGCRSDGVHGGVAYRSMRVF